MMSFRWEAVKNNYVILTLLLLVIVCCAFLLSNNASADDVVDQVKISVPVSCSMSGIGMESHNKEIANGVYEHDIGSSILHAFCNDNNGFAIYATGFANDVVGEENSNRLVGDPLGIGNIVTGIATSGDISNWAMKVTKMSDSGDVEGTNAFAIDDGFDDYHIVPNDYTKVAHKEAMTSMDVSTGGAKLATTYAVYINKTQPAGVYRGKVKYVLVHPHDHDAPDNLYGVTMQTVDEWGEKVESGKTTVAIDERDGSEYTVARLADDRLWMTKNLRLDFEKATVTKDNTNNPTNAFIEEADVKPQASNEEWCIYSDECVNHIRYSTIAIGDDTVDDYGYRRDDYGGHYNWYTATAGNGTSSTPNSTTVSGDICPKGWHLPSLNGANDQTGEYYELAMATKGDGSYDDSENVHRFISEPFKMVYSGSVRRSNDEPFAYVGIGERGAYWTATKNSQRDYAKYWMIDQNSMHSRNYGEGYLNYGNSVRCLANAQSHPLKVLYDEGVDSIVIDGSIVPDGNHVDLVEKTVHEISVSIKDGYHFEGWDATQGVFGSKTSRVTTFKMSYTSVALRAIVNKNVTFDDAYKKADKTKYKDYYAMQDMDYSICNEVTVGLPGELIDVRDDSVYSVAKLSDNKCWMTKNLRLDVAAADIDVSNTNNPTSTFLDEAPTAASSDLWCGESNSGCVDQVFYNTSNINDMTLDSSGHTYDDYGVYYNWYTATAGNGTFSVDSPATVLSGDICPKNWHLPTGTIQDSDIKNWHGDYWELATSFAGLKPEDVDNYGQIANNENMMNFVLEPNNYWASGGWFVSGSPQYRGNTGYYWSSTSLNMGSVSVLMTFAQGANVLPTYNKFLGFSVRCLAGG